MRPKWIGLLIVFFTCASSTLGQLYSGIHSVDVTAVQHLNEFSKWVDETAEFAIKEMSRKDKTKQWRLEEILREGIQLGAGVYYSTILQLPGGLNAALQFVEPRRSDWMQQVLLPSADETNTADTNQELTHPKMQAVELTGPIYLYFERPRDDVVLRLPNIVEAGTVSKIAINNGASVNATGVHSIRLMSPVDVDISTHQDSTILSWKQIPRIEVKGDHLGLVSVERTKVKRKGTNELEFIDVNGSRESLNSFVIPSNHALVDNINYLMGQLRAISDIPLNNGFRIISGNAEAVTLTQLPLVISDSGINSLWNVLVATNSDGEKKLISSEELPPQNQITVSPSLIVNGTMHEAIDSFISAFHGNNPFMVM